MLARAEATVLQANDAFYEAIQKRDFSAMERCWSHGDDVACTHPGWHRLDGWTEIARSWVAIFANSRPWRVACEDPRTTISEDIAVIACVERLEAVGGEGEPARMQATNVYRRFGEEWKMILHHASPMPEFEPDEEDDTVN